MTPTFTRPRYIVRGIHSRRRQGIRDYEKIARPSKVNVEQWGLTRSPLAHNPPIVLFPDFFTNRQVSDICFDGQAPSALCRLLPSLRTIRHCVCKATVSCLESDLVHSAARGLLVTDHVILNHGQVTWTTPKLAPPLVTTTPHKREDVSALDRFNVHRCPTRRVFSGTGLEFVTRQATFRYLYHSATAATNPKTIEYSQSSRNDTRAIDVGSRNFEPRSSDESETWAGILYANYHIKPTEEL
ncbi:uncharacterized protein TNCV_353891 [Trichonephila clavipes]|uniref:Uncharacterized protein n=1 Tax=Trichonephila clavipes TaxID=2585209 RepID=A0A8X7BBL2_TRICX|nr:uncharacterized protein TNCV_353891 [Trichonephila clavipes]